MKKILIGLTLVTAALMANDTFIGDAVSKSKSNYLTNNLCHNGHCIKSYVMINDKRDYSLKDINLSIIENNLRKSICSKPDMRRAVNEGSTSTFVYMLKDKTISISIDNCI